MALDACHTIVVERLNRRNKKFFKLRVLHHLMGSI
jgi:hypothetical protein